MRYQIALATALLIKPGMASADDATNANYLCAIINATGLTNTQCEMSAATSSVTTTIEISVAEAKNLCGKLVDLMAQRDRPFARHWVLNIRSPYSGKKSIAFCNLPAKAAPKRDSSAPIP